jgi:hypothetical protein
MCAFVDAHIWKSTSIYPHIWKSTSVYACFCKCAFSKTSFRPMHIFIYINVHIWKLTSVYAWKPKAIFCKCAFTKMAFRKPTFVYVCFHKCANTKAHFCIHMFLYMPICKNWLSYMCTCVYAHIRKRAYTKVES